MTTTTGSCRRSLRMPIHLRLSAIIRLMSKRRILILIGVQFMRIHSCQRDQLCKPRPSSFVPALPVSRPIQWRLATTSMATTHIITVSASFRWSVHLALDPVQVEISSVDAIQNPPCNSLCVYMPSQSLSSEPTVPHKTAPRSSVHTYDTSNYDLSVSR
jgi:hypothetical protein